jgi:hypothetical protein
VGVQQVTSIELLVEIIKEQTPEDIWLDSPLIGYRALGNTNRGAIGEEFIRRYLKQAGIETGSGKRTARTDMLISGHRFEIKTASMGANKTFQFNHVRLDRNYQYLLLLGICPHEIVYSMWRKGEVAEGRAGQMVRMAEGQAVTYKITKKLPDLAPIDGLPAEIRKLDSTIR